MSQTRSIIIELQLAGERERDRMKSEVKCEITKGISNNNAIDTYY